MRCISGFAAVVLLVQTAGAEPYPVENFTQPDYVSDVAVSPDGQRIGLLKAASDDGVRVLEIFESDNLTKEPVRLKPNRMDARRFRWVNSEHIVIELRDEVRARSRDSADSDYQQKIAIANAGTKKLRTLQEGNAAVTDLLPRIPGKIIVSLSGGRDGSPDDELDPAFRARSYWEYDLDRGGRKLLFRGKQPLANVSFDGNGNAVLARGFDRGQREYAWYVRPPGAWGWTEFYRLHESKFGDFVLHDIDPAKPNHVIVTARNESDTAGLWSYDYDKKKFDELIYQRSDVDVAGVRFHSNEWRHPDEITAVAYFTDNYHFEYFEDSEKSLHSQLQISIPNAHHIEITGRSKDGSVMTILNQGPRDPGTYYLLKDASLQIIGYRQPRLEPDKLADLRYIRYKTHDGRSIRAFLTIPSGEGPHPLIVMPHGGPDLQKIVIYDARAQMLANNGYLVFQPQLRMPFGQSRDMYMSAIINGGDAASRMQQEKDDGALHLVEEGLADPEKIALFGWSMGGYEALLAASRSSQIYRCVVDQRLPSSRSEKGPRLELYESTLMYLKHDCGM